MKIEGYQCQTLLGHSRSEAVDLSSVQEQLPGAFGLMPPTPGKVVRRDIRPDQERLTVADVSEAVFELGLAFPETFDLRALKHQACFNLIKDLIVVARSAIARNYLDVTLLSHLDRSAEVLHRVDRDATETDLEMQMGAGATPGATDIADDFAPCNDLAHRDCDA